jgi:hypothetical protein
MQCNVKALNPACDVQAHTLKVYTMSHDLKNHVQSIADNLTNPPDEWNEGRDVDSEGEFSAFDYLQDVLDIEYIVNGKGEYLGARVLVAFGGPTIWINTRTGTVEGSWWSARAEASFKDNLGLDDALSELRAWCR